MSLSALQLPTNSDDYFLSDHVKPLLFISRFNSDYPEDGHEEIEPNNIRNAQHEHHSLDSIKHTQCKSR